MSEQGVPIDEVTTKDHIQVRPKLVKRLGGANNALVWSRIYFRADDLHREAVEVDGEWWWPASMPKLSAETGLTEKQVRLALDELLDERYLVRRPNGKSFMYRPVVVTKTYLPSGADSDQGLSALEGRSIRPAGQTYLPSGAVTPLIDEEDVEDTPIVPAALFESVWAHWPKKTEKKLSKERFLRALKKRPQLVDDVVRFGDAYLATTETQYVPALAVWINRERWSDPLPTASARGGQQQRMDDDLALLRDLRAQEQRGGQGALAR